MIKLYNNQQRNIAIEAIRNAPDGSFVDIKPSTRSIEQNRLMWRLLGITAKSVPWTVNGEQQMISPDDWKAIFSASLHSENKIAKGLRGGLVMLGRSTSRMTVQQMTDMIELVYSFLADRGVDVPESEIVGSGEEFAMSDM